MSQKVARTKITLYVMAIAITYCNTLNTLTARS